MPTERPLDGSRRPRLTPAIADARRAVREQLADLPATAVHSGNGRRRALLRTSVHLFIGQRRVVPDAVVDRGVHTVVVSAAGHDDPRFVLF